MIKKAMATAAAAASIVGVAAAAAPEAMAIGNEHGTSSVNGNGARQYFGNSTTYGYMSPQIGLIQGSLNKPCLALGKLNLQGAAWVPAAGHQHSVVAAEPAVHRKLHPGQG